MINFFFKKKHRLFKDNQFNFVFLRSYRVFNKEFLILSRKNIYKYPRLGIRISSKIIKLSCKRNVIKRLIRESFRNNKNKLLYMDFVVIVKKNILIIKNNYLFSRLKNLWLRYYKKT
ncbi:ribonuclease P protein component [Buchnera aphidicola (Ceratoglyphina bambusae)]|uniref:ribonuclease P protein component n=1 Tax=Buchnera aphidicola TaxID=9 RepID=UPI0031B86814